MKPTKAMIRRGHFDKRSMIISLAVLFLVLLCGVWATTQLAMNTTYNETYAAKRRKDIYDQKLENERKAQILRDAQKKKTLKTID